jgi:hypothetical protein
LKFKDCSPGELVEEEPEVVEEEPVEPEPTTVPNPEDEDVNADGVINQADVNEWRSLFGGICTGITRSRDDNACKAAADINGDNSVDGRDLKQIRDAID